MKLFNTLTKEISEFKPQDKKEITIYSCGPTVYDHVHIGNLASFIYADSLHRALEQSFPNHKIKHVMNFTDVDDKTIRRSIEKYPDLDPKDALKKLTDEYKKVFLDDMKSIGNRIDSISFVHATDTIPQMQKLISKLYKDGFAYIADDGVYFSIKAYRDAGYIYGQLTPISSASTSKERIHNDEYDKDSPHDFALWKTKKENEPSWKFKLDGKNLDGRPGWHIECSVMSTMKLGQPFDIHTGGIDLIFPHHENEIAQSTAGNKIDYAKVFFHNEHLLVEGSKMSKSLNNFLTLKDIIEKGFDTLAFRLMVLQSHYRNKSNFTWEGLESAQNRLNNINAFADMKHQSILEKLSDKDEVVQTYEGMIGGLKREFSDDINTPSTLSFLGHYMSSIEKSGFNKDHFQKLLSTIDDMYGLNVANTMDISPSQKKLMQQRQDARDNDNWSIADDIRDTLEDQGIEVRDTESGQVWSRTKPSAS